MVNPVSPLNAGFPQAPFIDSSTGDIALVWRSFLISLYARTGGGIGTSTEALIASLNTEVTNRTTADTSLAVTVGNEAQARAAADAALGARIDLVPTPVGGMAGDLIRVNSRAAAYEVRTPLQTLGDIGAQPIKGVVNHSDALAGQIGEYRSATVLSGAAVPMVNNVAVNAAPLPLTAGDWDVWGNVAFALTASTVLQIAIAWLSTVSATVPTVPNAGGETAWVGNVTGVAPILGAGMARFSLSAPAVVYLSAEAAFGTSTLAAYGFIGARRVR